MVLRCSILLVGCAIAGGCVANIGPVVGYGTKHGVYGGVAGGLGASVAQGTMEIGGNRRGLALQTRLDVELSKARFINWDVEAERPYPGLHGGIGYGWGGGQGGLATVLGPDVAVLRNTRYCEGAPAFYVGLDWRHVGGESQFALAPRYEVLSDICLR
jgi:hypothetical protein